MYERRSNTFTSLFKAVSYVTLALVLTATGCRTKSTVAAPDDATLSEAVQVKLSSDTSLGGEPIQAAVQQGIATLNGTVSSDAARSLAANDVAQIAGIRTVINNLIIQPAKSTKTGKVVQPPTTVASIAPRPLPRVKPGKPAPRPATAFEDQALPSPPMATQETQDAPPAAPIERQQPEAPVRALAPSSSSIHSITLDSGTTLAVRITQTLDSATTQEGDTFSGVLASDILSDNLVVLSQGTPISGRVVTVQEAAHFKGNSLLTIELTSLDRKGDHLPLTTDTFSKAGNGRGKNSAEKIGGGAAVGAILGGILGGGKGAAIGAAAGGGAGAGVQAITRGQQVQIESETLMRFHLTSPVVVRVSSANKSQTKDDADLQRHN